MILLLYQFLHSSLGLKIPFVFAYSSTRMILAAITALVVTIFFGPTFIRFLYQKKIGQPIRKEECPVLAELHQKKEDTPTMGGLLMIASLLISSLLWMDLTHIFTWLLIVTLVAFGCIGAYDDWRKLKLRNAKGMSSSKKFLLQLIVAVGLSCALFYIPHHHQYITVYFLPFVKSPVFALTGTLTLIGFLFTIFIITGSSNAVNLTDGLDGLAAGCLIPVCLVLSIFAFLSNHIDIARYLNLMYIEKSSEVAVFLCAMGSASLGFLWYNGFPAQVFMGDTGSLSLGAVLGLSAVLLRREFLLALIGGVFVVEALSVILQVASYRLRNKKRLFLCAPLHHHFEYMGWPETKVVLRFWIIGFLLAAIGLASIKVQ